MPCASSSGTSYRQDCKTKEQGQAFQLTTSMDLQWSTLPGDIITAITKILSTDVDLLCLRSVCSSWRSSLSTLPRKSFSFPIKVPPLCSPSEVSGSNKGNGYFVLNQSTLYRLSPSDAGADGWLFKVSERNPNSFSLLVPLSTEKIKFPPDVILKSLNLLNYRISEICKSYSLSYVDPEESPQQYQPYIIRKVIVLSHYLVNCDYAVLALRYGGGMDYWKYGDQKWTPVNAKGYHFQDVIIFEGKCYAVDLTGVLVTIDSELNLTVVASSVGYLPTQQNYLVEYKSDLYLIRKIPSPDPEFYFDTRTIDAPLKLTIYKKKLDDWSHVGNLGDMTFFLGDDVSFGLSALDFRGLKGNCVFLTDECFYDDGMGSVYGDDTGVYDPDGQSIKALAVAQDYAKPFWPPPSWLMPCASSSGDC